ncbi:MAG TPA: DUF4232 domain-containing protein, partial [Acidimicrobiales bacterium]|nr:DUF4232 domain-containing protein [Acidimicrobiales bacterium]
MAAALVGVATAAGCSSSSSSSTTTSTRSTTTTSSQAGTTSSTSGSSPSTSAPAGLARCPTVDLVGSVVGHGGAAGTTEATVALRSTSASSCILGGYPGLQLLGS